MTKIIDQVERYQSKKEFNPAKFIDSFHAGDKLSDKDLLEAIPFFKDLEQKLSKCGPIYRLSANAMRSMVCRLEGFAHARNLL